MPSQETDNGMKLFKYLEELSLLNSRVRMDIRELSAEEENFDLDNNNFLPVLDGIFLKSRNQKTEKQRKDRPKDLFFSIKRYKVDNLPELPETLKRWIPGYPDDSSNESKLKKPEPEESLFITESFDDDKKRVSTFKKINSSKKLDPILEGWITKNDKNVYVKISEKQKKIYFKNFPELVSLYEHWMKSVWKKWKEKNDKYFQSNRVYEKLYALRSFLKTEKDNYDLLWGHDILTWSQNEKKIYHPCFFTPVTLGFNPDKNIILIKSDLDSKTFFDISFIREVLSKDNKINLDDIDSLSERINGEINKGDLDIWNYEIVHKYLQKLTRYISPDGESKYNNRSADIETGTYPTAFNYHHLLLLKKSGKSWSDYAKKIQEDIKEHHSLTPFLKDLIGEDPSETVEIKPSSQELDGELYFSLPYSEEQKKIANRIETNYGALVQGPPGTGKTHTIANLISRFLALGKTVLVTSQTGQALSVLKDKLPESIRSLAVSQVEGGGADLQSSASEINTNLSDTTRFTDKKKQRVQLEIQKIREEIAQKNNEFKRKSLMDSKEKIEVGSEKICPISASKFIKSFQNNDEFKILDDIKHDVKLAVFQNEIDDYISTLRNTDSEVWDDSQFDEIPSIEMLPSVQELKQYFELYGSCLKIQSEMGSTSVNNLIKFDLPDKESLDQLNDIDELFKEYNRHNRKREEFKEYLNYKDKRIEDYISGSDNHNSKKNESIKKTYESIFDIGKTLFSFEQLKWKKELLERIRNQNERRRMRNLLETMKEKRKKHEKNEKPLILRKITGIYNRKKALNIIYKCLGIRKRSLLEKIFGVKNKNFFEKMKIDGEDIDNKSDLQCLQLHFENKKIEEELIHLLDKTFSKFDNKPSYLAVLKSILKERRNLSSNKQNNQNESFDMLKFENTLDEFEKVICFEDKNKNLKDSLMGCGLFEQNDVNLSKIDFMKKAMSIFDNYCSCFRVGEYEKRIRERASIFQKRNAHPKVRNLADCILKQNVMQITALAEQIKKLDKQKKTVLKYLKLKDEIDKKTRKLKLNKNNHKAVTVFLQNIERGNIKEIENFYLQIPELKDRQNRSKEIFLMEKNLKKHLPVTVSEIRKRAKTGENIKINIEENWKWMRLVSWLDWLHSGSSISELNKELQILKNKEKDLIADLVEISAWIHLKKRVTQKQKQALASFVLSMRKYGKGKGKYASKHLKDAKKSLEKGKEAVPVWIMPINSIHQLFANPGKGMFDIVIFDEASQVNILGLNIAYIGKKLLVVGDDEQVSPTPFINQSKVTDLIERYISDIPNKEHFSVTSSLFDVAKIKMTDKIMLKEHFRSIDEVIGFSNQLSYDGRLKVLRDQLPKFRLEPVLEPVFVDKGYEETNAQVNKPEAEAIVNKLKEFLNNEKYKQTNEGGNLRPLTFGIISLLGKDQSKYITKLIIEQISEKEIEKREIVCGEPYTFQGDERDIIFISMVKASDLYNLNKTIRPYTVAKKENKQRINVAMSRAKNKIVLFHSIPKDKLSNPDDLRKKILDWFYNKKHEEKKSGLEAIRKEVQRGRASEFEYSVAKIIINRGYKVIPQYEVAGYRIDLVIQGKNARLAVECDGDKYHNRIEKWQEDMERQQILERAGWIFWRVAGSAFYRHEEKALDSLWDKLNELSIKPD